METGKNREYKEWFRDSSWGVSEGGAESKVEAPNPLESRSAIFHGIGFDVLKLAGITKHGLMSQEEARLEGVDLTRMNDGYNGTSMISFSESPAASGLGGYGAFGIYTGRDGISFIVDRAKVGTMKAKPGTEMDSGFPDEVYVRGSVAPEQIEGVMVDSSKLDSHLTELGFGIEKMGTGSITGRCLGTVAQLELLSGLTFDTSDLLGYLEEVKTLSTAEIVSYYDDKDRIITNINRIMQAFVQEAFDKVLSKTGATLRDVMKMYISDDLKVYDREGNQISL
jgi:hypothetical protein